MPIVTWSEEFSVNVRIIDDQHQEMLNIVNSLHTSVEKCADKETLQKLLVELYDHTKNHFSTEDELMKKHNYPGYEQHLHEHHVLLQHLNNLVEGVTGGKSPTFRSDYDVSSDWVLIHILKAIKNSAPFSMHKASTEYSGWFHDRTITHYDPEHQLETKIYIWHIGGF